MGGTPRHRGGGLLHPARGMAFLEFVIDTR